MQKIRKGVLSEHTMVFDAMKLRTASQMISCGMQSSINGFFMCVPST